MGTFLRIFVQFQFCLIFISQMQEGKEVN